MKILLIDTDGVGLAFALRCQAAGHEVRFWEHGKESLIGEGMVEKVKEWAPSMKWAELIVPTGNAKLGKELKPFFDKGLPIFGANEEGASWELDRVKGCEILAECDIPVVPYEEFKEFDSAIQFVQKNKRPYACKPWGGTADKSLSFVADSVEDTLFYLDRMKKEGLKGPFILQQRVDGIEMGVAGWFGPGGWSQWIEENWEEKKFLNEGLGCNTGEQGTVLRYTKDSALFRRLLEPLTALLHDCGYVGNVSVNCIIDQYGIPWPLEFTMRLGWPAFNLEMALHAGDPAKWMVELLNGKDRLQGLPYIAAGVVYTHGDYPVNKDEQAVWAGYPLRGLTEDNMPHLAFQGVMMKKAQMKVGSLIWEADTICTAGNYVLVAVGVGQSVFSAQQMAYDVAWSVTLPSNRMFRTDIGKRLKEQLPKLQDLGYATEMIY